MNRHGDVPPPGPDLPLVAWAQFVADRVRHFLPDVRASQRGQVIAWKRGACEAGLDATRPDWWMSITSSRGSGTGISTHSERHDRFTAEVAASNIVVHFDARFCRGLDTPPYTDHELKMLLGKG